MQPLGAVVSVLALAWSRSRAALLEEMARGGGRPVPVWLYYWVKYAIPAAVLGAVIAGLVGE